MFRSRTFAAGTVGFILAAALVMPALPVTAATPAHAWITPHKVKIGGHAMLYGSHLNGKSYYRVLMAVPFLRKGAFERFVGLVRTDVKGNLKVGVTIPVSAKCGPAALYVYPLRKQTPLRVNIKLTGCTIGKGSIKPPPPPSAPGTGKKSKP
jgi:hypothetical protein